MVKHRFLIAAAVTALTVGSGAALAQSPAPGGSSGKSQAPAASQSGGGAGSMSGSHSHGGTTGAGSSMSEPKSSGSAASESKGGLEKQNSAQDKSAPSSKERMGQSGKGKSETTGQAPKESQSGSAQKNDHMGKGKADRDDLSKGKNGQLNKNEHQKGAHGKEPSKSSTTGQGSPNQGGNMRNETQTQQGGQMRNNEREGGMNRSNSTTSTTNSTTTNTTVNLSTEQRTRIHEVIVKERNAPRVTNVDFSLSVGTRIPRGKVHFVAVPSTIVEIQPAWRGYEYFMVGDQIVIVNPSTLEIVAVIAA